MIQTQTQNLTALALAPADPLGARFCQYFNHPWKHIHRPLPAPGEKTQWITAKYFLNARTLWRRYLDPDTIIGLRFGETTHYCLLDVDRGSCYHPANDEAAFKSVLAALEKIGLCRPLVVRSSDSDGLHIYYFFDEPQPTFNLACALWFALNDAGLHVRSGQLETFPNMKRWGSLYNGCRLPLQVGSYLLDDNLELLTNDLAQFLDAADIAAAHQDLPALKEAISKAEKRPKRKPTTNLSADAEVWKAELEKEITQGWTGSGQTNELLQFMVAYGTVFQGLKGKELIDYVEATATAAPGYREHCGHQHEIRKRVREWVSSTERNEFYVRYCGYPNRRGTYKQTYGSAAANNVIRFKSNLNEQRSNEATDRLHQAVSHLKELGKLPVAIAARAKAIIATAKDLFGKGISMLTLRKPDYLKLWHPKYYEGGSVAQSSIHKSIDCEIQPEIQSLTSSVEKKNGGTASGSESIGLSGVINLEAHCVTQTEVPSVTQALNQDTVIQAEVSPECLSNNDSGVWITPPSCSTENQSNPESPKPLPSENSSSLDHTPPLMKVCDSFEQGSAPKGGSLVSGVCGGKQGEEIHTCSAAPSTPPTHPTPGWRILGIKLQAQAYAEKAVKKRSIDERRIPDTWEREVWLATAKMERYWRSGEPSLMAEVKAWLAADPSRKLNL